MSTNPCAHLLAWLQGDLANTMLTGNQRQAIKVKLGLGLLYLSFDDHQEGLEACAAVEALIEISAIETLLASFIVPLQGGDVKAEV